MQTTLSSAKLFTQPFMQEAGIPHTKCSVEKLFNLVDIDGSGIMEWAEFETFVANEIQEGRDFME